MAAHLVLVIFLTVFLAAKGKELAAPTLSVHPQTITKSGSVSFRCQTPVPAAGCLYTFDSAPGKTMPCHQTLNGSTLLSIINRHFSTDLNVACFYLNGTASPHSEKKVINVRDPGAPTMSVHPSDITEFSSVTLYCQPPAYVSVSSCSFYTLSGLQWARSSCARTLRGSDLLKKNQSAPAQVQVKCYYTEQNEEMSPSPHSEKTVVAVKALAPPTVILETSMITEIDRVILRCQPPSYISPSLCYFYSVNGLAGKSLDTTDCVQSVTGSDLLMVNESPPVEVQIHCYYIVKQESNIFSSPHSDKKSITVQATAITSTKSPSHVTGLENDDFETKITAATSSPLTSTLYNPATNTRQQDHVTESETGKAQTSEHLIIKLVILLTTCGVVMGCVMVPAAFFCTKRNGKVKSQAPNSGGQFLTGEYSLCCPESAVYLQRAVTENQADIQEANEYHQYASIPDKPYSVTMNNILYSSLQMTDQ